MNTIKQNQYEYERTNLGPIVIKTKVKKEDVKHIKKNIISKKGKPYHASLAGIIKDEYLIDVKKYVDVIGPYFKTFVDGVKSWSHPQIQGKVNFSEAWVNYMVAGEFNPPHVHNNCNLSSVLFVQVPKDLKKENEAILKRGITSSGPGTLVFQHGEVGFFTIIERTFLPEEGDLFIFPGSLKHYVSPFSCKGERITIASNAYLE